jgi:hypothetical protein
VQQNEESCHCLLASNAQATRVAENDSLDGTARKASSGTLFIRQPQEGAVSMKAMSAKQKLGFQQERAGDGIR